MEFISNMKDLINKIFNSAIEMDGFESHDIESILSNDKYDDLSAEEGFIDIKTKPDFSLIEEQFEIKMHSELVEYWSQIWAPIFTIENKKAITESHDDENIFVGLLTSQIHLEMLIDDIEMYTQEVNDDGIEGVFFPIAFKEDGWNILFNNLDGCVYIQEHDPSGVIKISNSIREFYSAD